MKRYLTVLLFWSTVVLLYGYTVLKLKDIVLFPALGAIFSILSITNKELFDIGISYKDKANLMEKIVPIAVAVILIYLTTFVDKTIPVAIFNSYLTGMTVSYIGKLIDER